MGRCEFYDEATNGLKMSLAGLAIGATAWFLLGTGAKESYEKRKREREREQYEKEREEQRHRHKMEERGRAASFTGRTVFGGWR